VNFLLLASENMKRFQKFAIIGFPKGLAAASPGRAEVRLFEFPCGGGSSR
jgi:hypothetical protein